MLLVDAGDRAQTGSLIKTLKVFESTRRVDPAVLDNTGGVTAERMSLATAHVAKSVSDHKGVWTATW